MTIMTTAAFHSREYENSDNTVTTTMLRCDQQKTHDAATRKNIPIQDSNSVIAVAEEMENIRLVEDNTAATTIKKLSSSSKRPPRRRSSLKCSSSFSKEELENISLSSSSAGSFSSDDLNKSVIFSTTARLQKTISHVDMTEEEKKKTWLSQEESKSIREHCRKIIQKVEEYGTNTLKSGKRLCVRGLESHFPAKSRRKKLNRFLAADEVFTEQEEQFESGRCYDDEAIASVYSSITSDCQAEAERIGAQDRKDIERYVQLFEDDLEEEPKQKRKQQQKQKHTASGNI